jgi:hypothetical protein
MDRSVVDRWIAGYVRAWNSNEPADIEALFTPDAIYTTEPYSEPWVGHQGIVSGWLEAKDEPGETEFEYEILSFNDGVAFVKGLSTYKSSADRVYSNLWVIHLDGDGRSTRFDEWWMKHPKG